MSVYVVAQGRIEDREKLGSYVTQALPTCARYSWQVRANYTSVGQARSTDWSPVKEFRTPCPKK